MQSKTIVHKYYWLKWIFEVLIRPLQNGLSEKMGYRAVPFMG